MLEFNGTAIVIAISFIIFVIIENFLFYKPMRKTLEERENYIENNHKEAQENLDKAQSLSDEKDKKIAEAKEKSSEIINKASLETKEQFAVSVKQAKETSNNELSEIKDNLQTEKVNAQNALKSEIATHATMIISKILKKDVALVNINDETIEKALRGEL